VPWALGPPDGRYLIRPEGAGPDAAPCHVLVLATLGAQERRRLGPVRRQYKAEPEPEPIPVTTARATVIDVGAPLDGSDQAGAWLRSAGEGELAEGLTVLNRALQAFRIAATDPHARGVARGDALVARLGYGAGEEVAEGRWTEARELVDPDRGNRRRRRIPAAQARFAALLTGRQAALTSEELVLRARLDLDAGRERVAALQVLIALDAALAELATDPVAPGLTERLQELRGRHAGVASAAKAAATRSLGEAEREAVTHTLARLEAALRARVAALPE
jgi:hypothetical protein